MVLKFWSRIMEECRQQKRDSFCWGLEKKQRFVVSLFAVLITSVGPECKDRSLSNTHYIIFIAGLTQRYWRPLFAKKRWEQSTHYTLQQKVLSVKAIIKSNYLLISIQMFTQSLITYFYGYCVMAFAIDCVHHLESCSQRHWTGQ